MKKTALGLTVLFLTVFSLSGCASILRWWDFVTGAPAASEQPARPVEQPRPLEVPPNDQTQLAGQPDEPRPLAASIPAPESPPLTEQSAALSASPEAPPVVSPPPVLEASPVVSSSPALEAPLIVSVPEAPPAASAPPASSPAEALVPEQVVSAAPAPVPPVRDSRNPRTESSRTETPPASSPMEQTVVSAPPVPPAVSPAVRQAEESPPVQPAPSRPQGLQPSGGGAQNARPPAPSRPPASPSSLLSSYTVRWGDSLWSIAGNPRVYNNPYQWRRLYNANRRKLVNPNNPHLILPGTVLTIPRP